MAISSGDGGPGCGVSAAEDERRIAEAIGLARRFVAEAARREARLGFRERQHRGRMRLLVHDPEAANFVVRLSDEIPRIADPSTAGRRFAELVDGSNLHGFALHDQWTLRAGSWLARRYPKAVMPFVMRRLRSEASSAIVLGGDRALAAHLSRRRSEGMRSNINVLGEAIVGHDEARSRLDEVLRRLEDPQVDYVSVKVSAICANLSPLAFDATLVEVRAALRELYTEASRHTPAKFVTLDMEEYRDLELTVAAFRTVLDEEAFHHLDAGIVLQSYLPDARLVARHLGEWAASRRATGGGHIKVRLVKGANLAMELVEAELHGWDPAPYDAKSEVDANYKAILDVLIHPTLDDSVRIGLASHNLFDVAWALGLNDELRVAGRPPRIEIEMLEGMEPAQAAAVRKVAGDLLLYTPVVERGDFPAAIAYLVRRLDENTSSENFLAHLFDLADNADEFQHQADRFAAAVRLLATP